MFEHATDDVIEIAEELIEAYHPHLQDARIGFLFRDVAPVSKKTGKMTLGKASTVPPKYRAVVPYDFLIWVARDAWEDNLDEKQRRALIDHELCHCGGDVLGGFYIRPHDIEEFDVILARRGLWTNSLRNSKPAMQLSLNLDESYPVPESAGSVIAVDPKDVKTLSLQ